MMSTWSPLAVLPASPLTSSSTDRARRPLAPSVATTASASQPRSGGANIHTESAAASEGASVSRCTPMRIVAERGSSTATMRLPPDLAPQAVDGRGDGRGVMREIVVHRDAAHFAAQLHAAFDALEFRERRDGLRHRKPRHAARRRWRPARSRRCARLTRTTSPCPRACRLRAPRTWNSRRPLPRRATTPLRRRARARILRAASTRPSRAWPSGCRRRHSRGCGPSRERCAPGDGTASGWPPRFS